MASGGMPSRPGAFPVSNLSMVVSELATNQGVIRVPVGALKGSCLEHVSQVSASREDKIYLIPVFRAGVSPGDRTVLLFRSMCW